MQFISIVTAHLFSAIIGNIEGEAVINTAVILSCIAITVQKIIPSTDGQTMKQVEYAQVVHISSGTIQEVIEQFFGNRTSLLLVYKEVK